jgi:membrane-associated protease RseP (regulator of RpoE activity)
VQSEIEAVSRRQIERDLAVDGGPPGFPAGSPEARELAGVLARDYARMARDMTAMARALAAQQASMVLRAANEPPRGRMGVTLTGRQQPSLREGRMYMQYLGPQVIEAVEPGGPADQAGIEAGDTLLALGKVRLEDAEVPIAELLVPGEKLPVTVRRKGATRTMTMTVGERSIARGASPLLFYVETPCPPGRRGCEPVARGAVAATVPQPPRPPSPAEAIVTGQTSWQLTFDGSLAGAVLATIDRDLEELLGTDRGAFVLRVAPGTPAADAGLRSGDVIVGSDAEPVATPADVRRAFQRVTATGARTLALVVARRGTTRAVTLKW